MTKQMMEWQVEEWIRDYNFMLREIARLNRLLNAVHGGRSSLVAAYGDDAGMPKGSSGISQAELRQLDIRERRLLKYEAIVQYLDEVMGEIKDEKEKVVYDCMIEGLSYSRIAVHLGKSRDTIRKVKEGIIGKIVKKVEKDQFLQKLKSIKSAV
ncbi:hypothetical protein [Bacillus badius]|uniref:YJCO protein n=1 Tax=Bacillus badius TaxID=1455 RepID=A0ABR5B264_BACBA|nr:hypothetical protein [Bacillus badius]KIL80716.1 YJCO protein [Bacillus badius]MED4715356.1 hypothetical protein [Bacillus badius]